MWLQLCIIAAAAVNDTTTTTTATTDRAADDEYMAKVKELQVYLPKLRQRLQERQHSESETRKYQNLIKILETNRRWVRCVDKKLLMLIAIFI